jgi:hypothetical protein
MTQKSLNRFSQIFQDMPAVNDLLGLWSPIGGSTPIGFRAITANDLHSRMLPEPLGQGFRTTILQQVHWLVRFSIEEECPIGVSSSKGKIIHA